MVDIVIVVLSVIGVLIHLLEVKDSGQVLSCGEQRFHVMQSRIFLAGTRCGGISDFSSGDAVDAHRLVSRAIGDGNVIADSELFHGERRINLLAIGQDEGRGVLLQWPDDGRMFFRRGYALGTCQDAFVGN